MQYDDCDVEQLIATMADALKAKLSAVDNNEILMIGIHTGGVWVAQRLHQALEIKESLGILDIAFYRDDFSRIGLNPKVKPSQLPVSVDNKHILLVDDILHTGRTVRAAMNEVFDYGRPATVTLVVLGERSGRELPIQPDIVGKHFSLDEHEHVKLSGPDKLQISISATQ
jgi:pyrimidine operon attenuation protein/uracil phosphoribosyltransferase